jgi:amino acid transporter
VALTGIEAISNGVPSLKEPETRNAQHALLLMAGLFACMFLGQAFLAGQLGIISDPSETETIHSQITRTLLGTGALYMVVQGAAVVMLVLAGNTGFAAFPRLLAALAQDKYLPAAFSPVARDSPSLTAS